MRVYKNGDICPCCGRTIHGMSEEFLWIFSLYVDMARIPPWEAQPMADVKEGRDDA